MVSWLTSNLVDMKFNWDNKAVYNPATNQLVNHMAHLSNGLFLHSMIFNFTSPVVIPSSHAKKLERNAM
jgi:hypothetical protein